MVLLPASRTDYEYFLMKRHLSLRCCWQMWRRPKLKRAGLGSHRWSQNPRHPIRRCWLMWGMPKLKRTCHGRHRWLQKPRRSISSPPRPSALGSASSSFSLFRRILSFVLTWLRTNANMRTCEFGKLKIELSALCTYVHRTST